MLAASRKRTGMKPDDEGSEEAEAKALLLKGIPWRNILFCLNKFLIPCGTNF